MTCYVVPVSLDLGGLGQAFEADSPEAAARLAASTALAAHAHEPMIVRWEVLRAADGSVRFARVREVAPDPAAKAPPKAESPKKGAKGDKAAASKAEAPADAPADAPKAE